MGRGGYTIWCTQGLGTTCDVSACISLDNRRHYIHEREREGEREGERILKMRPDITQ